MKKLASLILLICLFSCSIQKRHYQKGYFISRKTHASHNPLAAKESSQKKKSQQVTETNTPDREADKTGLIPPGSLGAGITGTQIKTKRTGEDSCDVLLFKDGSEVKAKIVEISGTQVKYKKCLMPDGPVYITNKTELFMIQYKSGVKEVIKTPEVVTSTPTETYAPVKRYRRKNTALATTSYIFGLLGLYPLIFVGSITAIITSVIQLNKIAENPDDYGGERRARVGLILGIIGLVFWIFFITALVLTA